MSLRRSSAVVGRLIAATLWIAAGATSSQADTESDAAAARAGILAYSPSGTKAQELFLGGVYLYNTGIDPDADEHHFAYLARLGINAAHITVRSTAESAATVVQQAADHGIHLLIQIDDAYHRGDVTPEGVSRAAAAIRAHGAQPHVIGFSVREEPAAADIPSLLRYYGEISEATGSQPTYFLLQNRVAAIAATSAAAVVNRENPVRITGTDRYVFRHTLSAGGYLLDPRTALDQLLGRNGFPDFARFVRPDQHAVAVMTGNTIRDRHPLYALHLRYGTGVDRWLARATHELSFLRRSTPAFTTLVRDRAPAAASSGYAFFQYAASPGKRYQAVVKAHGEGGARLGLLFLIYNRGGVVTETRDIGVWDLSLSAERRRVVTADFGISRAEARAGLTGRLVFYRSNEGGVVTVDEAWLRETTSHHRFTDDSLEVPVELEPGRYRVALRARLDRHRDCGHGIRLRARGYGGGTLTEEGVLLEVHDALTVAGETLRSAIIEPFTMADPLRFIIEGDHPSPTPAGCARVVLEDAWVEDAAGSAGNQGLSFDGDAIYTWTYYRPPLNAMRAMTWLAVATGYRSVFTWSADYDPHYRGITGIAHHDALHEFAAAIRELQPYGWLINRLQLKADRNYLRASVAADEGDLYLGSFDYGRDGRTAKVVVAVNRDIGSAGLLESTHPTRWPADYQFRISDDGELLDYESATHPRHFRLRNTTGEPVWDLATGVRLADDPVVTIAPGGGHFLVLGSREVVEEIRSSSGMGR